MGMYVCMCVHTAHTYIYMEYLTNHTLPIQTVSVVNQTWIEKFVFFLVLPPWPVAPHCGVVQDLHLANK